MLIGADTTRRNALTFWGRRFGPDGPRIAGGRTSSLAVQRLVPRRPVTFGAGSGSGTFTHAVINRWRTSLRHFTISIGYWSAGRCGNTSVSETANAEQHSGCGGLRASNRRCAPTGAFGRRRLDAKSRMSCEVHVQFREDLGVQFPWATRLSITAWVCSGSRCRPGRCVARDSA
jgi:hypothetical protein